MSKLLLNESPIKTNNEWALVLGLQESLVFSLVLEGVVTKEQIYHVMKFASVQSIGRWLRKLEDDGFLESETVGTFNRKKYYRISKFPDLEQHKTKRDKLNKGIVYFAQRESDSLVKIGMTSDLKERFNALERKHGRMKLLLAFESSNIRKLESFFHEKFSSRRRFGEWFELNASELKEANMQYGWCKDE